MILMNMAKNSKNSIFTYLIMLLLVIVIILVSFMLYFVTKPAASGELPEAKPTETPELSVPSGFIKPDSIEVTGTSVLIKKGCRALSADTTPERAIGIFNALYNRTDQRPDIYEGFASLLQSFDIKIEYVLVQSFENNTFYSDAYFRSGNDILQLDMKPSDAMAIALRAGANIYFNTTLFNEISENICQ